MSMTLIKPAMLQAMTVGIIVTVLSACSFVGNKKSAEPPRATPADIASIPDATPRKEPRSRYGNPESYVVFGQRYYLLDSSRGFRESGIASWYGPNFHGKNTSSGEVYDMNKMTAAHKTLPIPCYVEVTNLDNDRSIIVRVNDRGPFHEGRVIDLSYVAAEKLDIVRSGTGRVEIRVIDPDSPQAHRRQSPRSTPITDRSIPKNKQAVATPVETKSEAKLPTPMPSAQTAPAAAPVPEPNREQSENGNLVYIQVGAFSSRGNALKLGHEVHSITQQAVSIIELQIKGKTIYKVRVGPINDKAVVSKVVDDLNQAGHDDQNIVFQ